MIFLRNLLATLMLLVLLAISVVGVMAYFPALGSYTTRINAMGNNIIAAWEPKNSLLGLFGLWLGLMFCTLLTFFIAIPARRRPTRIEVQMGDGRVVILETAIRKYIKTALADLPDVNARRIELRQQRNGLQADIYANVRTHEKLPDVERQIIRRVRHALSDELGIAQISGVHVYIKDFEVRPKPGDVVAFEPGREQPRDERERDKAPRPEPAGPTKMDLSRNTEALPRPAPAPAFQPAPPEPRPLPQPQPVGPELESPSTISLATAGAIADPEAPSVLVPEESTPTFDAPVGTEGLVDAAPRGGFFSKWRKPKPANGEIEMPGLDSSSDSNAETESTDKSESASEDGVVEDIRVLPSESALTNEEVSRKDDGTFRIPPEDEDKGMHQ